MAYRTTEDAVRAIVDNSTAIDMTPFIQIANRLVTKIDAADTSSELDDTDLELIERWLAAHFYAHRDQLLSSKSTSGASGSFQGQTGMFFTASQYGQTALLFDTTGYLANLEQQAKNGRQKVSVTWLGSTQTQQDGYEDIYE